MPDGSSSTAVEPARILEQLSGRAREIVLEARKLLDEQGLEELSMRNLAARLGMRAPSLYKHFANKESLESVLISIGFEEQAALFEAALRSSRQPLIAMARAYRAYARDHPGLYRLMYDRELNRRLLRRGSEEHAVLPVVTAAGGNRDLARAAFAFAHGMTILELNGRFPRDADLDAAWQRGMTALQNSVGQNRRRRTLSISRRSRQR
jgi:AcrR family transcriptional regulator